MNLALRGPGCNTGYGRVYRSLAKRLATRVNTQVLVLNNHAAPDFPLPVCHKQTFRDFGLLVGYPLDIHQLGTKHRLLYTMAEVSDIPDAWKPDLCHAHEVWVPTQFSLEVFGLYHPRVKVVPVGYEDETFRHEERDADWRAAFWSTVCPDAVGKRVFGTAGVMSRRKGIDVLVRAWEYAALEDAALVVKTRETREPIEVTRGVYVIDEDWADEKLADFYRALDVFVLPTRGEGLALCPLEAAACGTPSIVTRATGPADYIDDRGIYGIEIAGHAPVTNMSAHHARWVEPSIDSLVDSLRSFCDNPPGVEHHYRHWSMSGLLDRWERELLSAERRRPHV